MLIVDQHADPFDIAQAPLSLVEAVAVPDDGALGELTSLVPLGIVSADDDLAHALGSKFVRQRGDGQHALGVLGTRHRHDFVVQQLVGDVDARSNAGLDGELAGVEERSIADVLEQVGYLGERGLSDPLAAFPTHLGDPGDGAVLAARNRHHDVTADSAACQRSLGYRGRTIVRASTAEIWGPLSGKHFQ